MSVVLTNKTVKCRKNHKCGWCGDQIDYDDQAHYRSGIYDGEFFSEYMHPECWDALGRSDMSLVDYEFSPMEQQRGKTYEESHYG